MSNIKELRAAIQNKDFEAASNIFAASKPDIEGLRNLSTAFMFLSFVFRYPADVYESLGEVLPEFERFIREYAGEVMSLGNKRLMEQDYVRLFINSFGGMKANPYVSSRLDSEKLLWGDKMLRLKEMMASEGLAMGEGNAELEDHVAVVLEFCSLLTAKAVPEGERCSMGSVLSLLEITRDFFPVMAGSFADDVINGAESDFYKTSGKLLKNFISEADGVLDELLFPAS